MRKAQVHFKKFLENWNVITELSLSLFSLSFSLSPLFISLFLISSPIFSMLNVHLFLLKFKIFKDLTLEIGLLKRAWSLLIWSLEGQLAINNRHTRHTSHFSVHWGWPAVPGVSVYSGDTSTIVLWGEFPASALHFHTIVPPMADHESILGGLCSIQSMSILLCCIVGGGWKCWTALSEGYESGQMVCVQSLEGSPK